jgi:hypothetical protein
METWRRGDEDMEMKTWTRRYGMETWNQTENESPCDFP